VGFFEGDGPLQPFAEGVVVVCLRAVGERDLEGAVAIQARSREQQLRHAPRGQPETRLQVEDREAAVAFEAVGADLD
jgi:hypothetical protein